MVATLTSKGQLTLPKAFRSQLRLHAGDRLEFFVRDDGHVEMVRTRMLGLDTNLLARYITQDGDEAPVCL